MKSLPRAEVYVDGACSGNPGPAGIGVVLFADGASNPTRQLSHYIGESTNNVAEYVALLYALQEALQLGYRAVSVKTDSELLVKQLQGVYKVRDGQLRVLHGLVRHLVRGFQSFQIAHVPRTRNRLADRLAGQAVRRQAGLFDN